MSDMFCCPLKTGLLAGSTWPGKLCPDPSMWVSPVTNNAQLVILYRSYPALPTVARWTVDAGQMLLCNGNGNDITTSTIAAFQNKLESPQKCTNFQQKWIF